MRRSRIEENEEEKQKRQRTDAEAKRRSRIKENEEEKKKCQQTNAEVMKRTRMEEKVKKQTSQQSIEFPPDIDDHIMKKCLQNFIDATSNQALGIVECAVCAEGTNEFEKFDIDDLPGSDILRCRSLDDMNNDNDEIMDEYMFLDLILSQGGIDEEGLIHCCLSCINYLRKNTLPPLSIANGFQIGKTPDILKDLTLPEKLLIALYRPKMYITKLRSYAGPGTAQRGLKGNAITFPQDVFKIAETLPSNTDILLDHIKAVFLGSKQPMHNLLKKIFRVRHQKVCLAIEYLINNHSLYHNVPISNVNLPQDDIPDKIMKTLVCHESTAEDDAEHSNYTPQIDISQITDNTITMDSSGIIDADGATVHTNQQRQSAVQRLQGTLYVPHATLPVNDYNNPSMWLGAYPWLFPHGKGGPEIERKVPVSLKAYVKHLLNLKDRKFCLDQSFKFHVFNIL